MNIAASSDLFESAADPATGKQTLEAPQVDLRFSVSPTGVSYLSRQLAGYPYHAGRLLKKSATPEHMAVLFLQCTSGGLFEHDRIRLELHAGAGAVAQVKHAAATVVHSMTTGYAQSSIGITLEAGAYLEYIANLAILFPDASLHNQVQLTVHPGAIAVISEAYASHDPRHYRTALDNGPSAQQKASPSPFGELQASTTVHAGNGSLLVRDHLHVTGEIFHRHLSGVNASFDVHGGLYIVMPDRTEQESTTLLALITEAVAALQLDSSQAYMGMGSLPNTCGIFVRVLAKNGELMRSVQDAVTQCVRTRYADRLDAG